MDLSRRELIVTGTAAGAASALPWTAAAAAAAQTPPSGPLWDLTDLYPSDAAWTSEKDAAGKAIDALVRFKGALGDGAEALRTALQAISDQKRRLERLAVYAGLKADADTASAPDQERRQLAQDLATRLDEAVSWVDPELLAVGAAKIMAFEASDPGLGKFHFALHDVLRLAPHTLSPESEKILASAGTVLAGPEQIRTQLVNSDIPWPEVTLSTGEKVRLDAQGYTGARASPVRADRKLVFDTFWPEYGKFQSSLGASLATRVQGDIFAAKSRKFASALESALSANNIPTSVYKTLVAETNAGLPVLHRYFELRRRLLGLDKMYYYDIYPPAVKSSQSFDIATIRRLTLEGVAPLGRDYVATLKTATAARWADPFPRKGKVSGAYMNPGAYDVHPYLLLNMHDDYESLSTYAHEWGHAMHSLLASKAQPYETADYPIFTAEIASTCNEQLLNAYMVAGAKTPKDKLFYLDQLAELYRGTFFRQAMFAEFELRIHETVEAGGSLSGEGLTKMYLALLQKYHGDAVSIDPVYAAEWAYIPHFYYDFYVYQYATSIAASAYFAGLLLKDAGKARETYLGVLRAGGSDYPVEILKRAGLDMTSPTPYRALVSRFAEVLDQMEALAGKA